MKALAPPNFILDDNWETWRRTPYEQHVFLRARALKELYSRDESFVGFWGDDPLTISIMRRLGEIIQDRLGMKNNFFIPEDHMKIILCIDDGLVRREVILKKIIQSICDEYKIKLTLHEVWELTFGELVEKVSADWHTKNDVVLTAAQTENERKNFLLISTGLVVLGNFATTAAGGGILLNFLQKMGYFEIWKNAYVFTVMIGVFSFSFTLFLLMPATIALLKVKDFLSRFFKVFLLLLLLSALVLNLAALIIAINYKNALG